MLEQTTKTINGEERTAVRWGPDGTAYVCASEGDCDDAARKAIAWAQDNGVPAAETDAALATLDHAGEVSEVVSASDNRRRRFTAR